MRARETSFPRAGAVAEELFRSLKSAHASMGSRKPVAVALEGGNSMLIRVAAAAASARRRGVALA
jgi:hypothetical protein